MRFEMDPEHLKVEAERAGHVVTVDFYLKRPGKASEKKVYTLHCSCGYEESNSSAIILARTVGNHLKRAIVEQKHAESA
jgi:hypothetical protein